MDFSDASTADKPSFILSGFKKDHFLRTLKDEILQIEHLPLENSLALEEISFYNKIYDHLDLEKQQKTVNELTKSPLKQVNNSAYKSQTYYEGQEQLLSVKITHLN